jgi:Tol biopolymer transport system component
VAFVSRRGAGGELYVKRADGSAPAELMWDEERIAEVTYSPDGEWEVYRVGGGSGGRDLLALQVGADSAPVALVATEYEETSPALSPDGRWLAYSSNESGRYEVYVRPFPNTNDAKVQVSTDGGQEPLWAHSGRELFYNGGGNLMSAQVLLGTTFIVGEQRVLFSTQRFRTGIVYRHYDVTPDDQRFVMIRIPGGEDAGELIVVENFFEELKAKVGN